jgi:hypothetical protein
MVVLLCVHLEYRKAWLPVERRLNKKRSDIQSDQKVSVYLMITIWKVTSNVQSVPCQSPGPGGH